MIRKWIKSHLRKDNIKAILEGTLFICILGFLFYKSFLGILFISPLIYFYRKSNLKKRDKERKWKLNLEFRDGIHALSAALEAGYSAEHAFEEACTDLCQIYEQDALIVREFRYITNQINMNITVEKALEEFAARTAIDDILNFAEVFNTAKRTGGDLIKVIKITSNIISDKIDVKREIITLITAKRLEANIMKIIPLIILFYLSVSSPGFLDPLYHNILGVILMTLCLMIYLIAYMVIDKIIAIEI